MWRHLFRPHARDADLEEELQAHLAIEAKQLADGGLSRHDAELQARRQFGSQALMMELTREAWGWAGIDRFCQDIRCAARVLRRFPAFTITSVLSLALGMAVSTAIFSIFDAVFLRPLPYADAGQLMWVGITLPSLGGEFLPSPDYIAWRRDNHVFQRLAATQGSFSSTMILGGTEPTEVHVGRVSANFFDTFAVAPVLGRTFNQQEELPNGPKVVMLTNQFWRDYFHTRTDVIGSIITLDSQPYTIKGVLPPSFVNPVDISAELFTTIPVPPSASHRDPSMSLWAAYGRLKPSITIAQARADIATLFAASKADAPQIFRGDNRPVLQPLQLHRVGDVHMLLFVLVGAAGCLLAIACANVANLLLARWSASAEELAVRAALGANRARLSRQLFTEIALLIAAGTGLAMILVAISLRTFARLAARELPRLSQVSIDSRVFGIALLVSITTALIFGCLPIIGASRINLLSALQAAGRSSTSGTHGLLRRTLVALEVALSVVLLSSAALLFQTLWHMQNDHLGFRPEHVLSVSVSLRTKTSANPAREALASDLLNYIRGMPGTEAAALTQCTPLAAGTTVRTLSRSDRPLPEAFHRGDNISVCGAGPEYLKAAGARLLKGRFFTEDDFHHPGTVAVINEAAARAYFPGESAIGKQILGCGEPWKTIVGVIADTKNHGLNRPAMPEAIVNDFRPDRMRDLLFLVRTLAGEDFVARNLREYLAANHPGLFTKTETLDHAIGQLSASTRFNTVLLSTFAAIAFVIALIGIYGVLAFSVAQRRQEIGIRIALGATPRAVIALITREGAALVVLGALTGVAEALCLTRPFAALLYGVKPNDPGTYAVVIIGIMLTAAVASLLPAYKAAAVHPAVAVRQG